MSKGHTLTAPLVLREIDANVVTVVVEDGPNAGLEHPFVVGRLLVGSSEDAGLVLDDPLVSRLHCELSREGDSVRLRDLASKNGVWASGCRIVEAILSPSARVVVGGTTLAVRVERRTIRVPAWRGPDQLGALLGASAAMHTLFALIERVAAAELPVLIHGETGTGKELVARAIHDASARAGGPFVVVDGGALSESLADSELFGHVRGAFTGATHDRPGAFERAAGGTVFIDEVAELPASTQPKLLRALQERMIKPIGADTHRRVDVRILSATHQNLGARINEGAFREDLYFRLAGAIIDVPPLRERGGDPRLLAEALVAELAPETPASLEIVRAALADLEGYRWPGNVRELRSMVVRSLALGDPSLALPTRLMDGPARIRTDLPYLEARDRWMTAFNRQYVRAKLDEAGGNVSEASRLAGIAKSTFHALQRKLGF